VVELIPHSGHLQAVDHLKHGRVHSAEACSVTAGYGHSMRCMEAKEKVRVGLKKSTHLTLLYVGLEGSTSIVAR
jgi:hypothetical protein